MPRSAIGLGAVGVAPEVVPGSLTHPRAPVAVLPLALRSGLVVDERVAGGAEPTLFKTLAEHVSYANRNTSHENTWLGVDEFVSVNFLNIIIKCVVPFAIRDDVSVLVLSGKIVCVVATMSIFKHVTQCKYRAGF